MTEPIKSKWSMKVGNYTGALYAFYGDFDDWCRTIFDLADANVVDFLKKNNIEITNINRFNIKVCIPACLSSNWLNYKPLGLYPYNIGIAVDNILRVYVQDTSDVVEYANVKMELATEIEVKDIENQLYQVL